MKVAVVLFEEVGFQTIVSAHPQSVRQISLTSNSLATPPPPMVRVRLKICYCSLLAVAGSFLLIVACWFVLLLWLDWFVSFF